MQFPVFTIILAGVALLFSTTNASALPVTLLGKHYNFLDSPLMPLPVVDLLQRIDVERDGPVGRATRFRAMRRSRDVDFLSDVGPPPAVRASPSSTSAGAAAVPADAQAPIAAARVVKHGKNKKHAKKGDKEKKHSS